MWIFVPSVWTISPFTATRPAQMISSLARREATPASARYFWRRTMVSAEASRAQYRSSVPVRESPGCTPSKSGFRLGFSEPGDAVSGFPLTAFFKQGDALEALQDVAFCAGSAGRAQATVL